MAVSAEYTVLLVEDDPNDAMLIRRACKRAGVHNPIEVVFNGGQAIRYLKAEEKYVDRERYPFPGFIITDIKMPSATGLDLLQWIKDHQQFSVVPTMVLSSSALPEDINLAYSLGANAYMVKPQVTSDYEQIFRVAFEFWGLCSRPLVTRLAGNIR